VAITPVVIVMFIVSQRPAPVAVSVQPQTASVVAYSQPTGTVNAGMSPVDVQQALGRPDTVKPMSIGGVNTQEWYYNRAGGHTFEVHFNGAGVVDTWANY